MDTMTSAKVEVLWSPVHHNKFIIWGPDITLYEVGRIKEIEKKTSFVSISSTRGASVVASHSAHGVRCLDLSAIPDLQDPLLALGYANGRVGLTTLKQMFDPMGFAGRVFAPKYPRLCNSVSWSHSEPSMLAVAMEKHRSDHCILIWDVHRDTLPWSDVNDASPPEQPRPLAEMGLSETAHSVSWANCGYRTLVASMNLKYIKVFDLRDWSNKAVSSTGRGQWSGALAAPAGWQLAARADAGVALWDLRHMQRPLLTLHHPKPVAALHWCPTRRNLLLTLQKDSSSVRLYDIQQAHNDTKNSSASSSSEVLVAPAIEADVEEYSRGGTSGDGAGVLEREVTPAPGALALLAVAWHPAHEARLLAVCANGSIVDYTVCERVTVAWGGGHGGAGALAWTGGGGVLNVMNDDFYSQVKDISHVMKKRAQTDYGLKPDLWQNADLAEDESVSAMWHFLALSKSLVEDGCIRGSPWRHPGVLGVLGRAEGGYRSEGGVLVVGDVPARRVAVYRSAERARALQLCGWGWGWDSCAAGVERAEAEGTPCRAAALAAFHLRVRAALDVLGRAREPQLRVVALALAGLGDERLWRDALAAARPALPDAYLRALLAFLAATQPAAAAPAPADYAGVLAETEMRLEDRVAFACVYLCDARLHEFLARTADALTRRGELAGLLLTGLAPEGVALLAAWVARTHDVQTAALVAARCATPDLLHHHTVQQWLDSYRLLLDSWQLWWARCALDTWVRQGAGAEPEGRQVAVACTYCGKSVAAPPPRPGVRPTLARLPPPAAKMKQTSSCPSCRKPLPRCAVCGLHLGTAAGGAPFAGWFSWCVACRHGGHAAHLIEWFSEHTECPVSSCNCHCSTLDPPDRHC